MQKRKVLGCDVIGLQETRRPGRTEFAAAGYRVICSGVQAMHGVSCAAQKVQDGLKTSISFGVKTKPPDLPCRDDVLVEDGAAAPKSCLSSLEMRTTTAAGGLVSTGKTSTETETTLNEPFLQFFSAEEANCKKDPTPSASYGSSVWNLLAASSFRKVIETKSGENMTFDPGGSQGRLRACPVLGSWRALLCGVRLYVLEQLGDELQRFFGGDSLALLKQGQF